MINWIKGAKIRNSKILSEGYKLEENSIVSVLNAESIIKVIESFIEYYETQRFFFFFQVPCNIDEEKKLKSSDCNLHKNIYYLDNIGADDILKMLELFGEIFINDGVSAFGFGNHEAEIGKYKYNMVTVFSDEVSSLKEIFKRNGIPENSKLLTPWDIINRKNPGECSVFKDSNGKNIYDIVNALKQFELYKAETRED